MALSSFAVVRAAARYTLSDGQDHVNVFYLRNIELTNIGDQAVIDAIVAWLQAAYNEIETRLTNEIVLQDVKVDEVELIGGKIEVVRNVGTGLWGGGTFTPTAAGTPLPPGVAALVKFLTDKGKIYGRKFIGGLVEGLSDAGILDSAPLAAFAAFGAKILENAVTAGLEELRVGVLSTSSLQWENFLEVDASANLAYQRRRRRGTGS